MRETLQSFHRRFPDPSIRHRAHQGFAHQFLPPYIFSDPEFVFSKLYRDDLYGGVENPTRFFRSRWTIFENFAGLCPEDPEGEVVRLSNLTAHLLELGGAPSVLIEMPAPEDAPEAYFVAVAFSLSDTSVFEVKPNQVNIKYITLELCSDTRICPGELASSVLCEWYANGDHGNYCQEITPHRDTFIESVSDLLRRDLFPKMISFPRVASK